jgi:hypothetical protein
MGLKTYFEPKKYSLHKQGSYVIIFFAPEPETIDTPTIASDPGKLALKEETKW